MNFNQALLAAFIAGLPFSAAAGTFQYNYSSTARLSGSYDFDDSKTDSPAFGNFKNSLQYNINNQTFFKLSAAVSVQSGTYLDNLNQGKWGEEIYGQYESAYGSFYVGQMPNSAQMLSVDRPNLSIWQAQPLEIASFIQNPNWRQHNRQKYYNTLTSTLPNAEGSSFKISFQTPEFYNTVLGLTYVPQNDANDGLTSKFAPYADKTAYIGALYHHQEFSWFDSEFYLSFADYQQSHQEYAGGISLYRKGWTWFASYRQTEITGHDTPIAKIGSGQNHPAYYDGWRNGKAWNSGIGYEFALFNMVVSYFESRANQGGARNRIFNWQNTVKINQYFDIYAGAAYVDFKACRDDDSQNKRGPAVYIGIEFKL